MKRILAAVAICAACGSPSDPGDAKTEPKPLVFEPWSPPQHTSYDIFLASRGGVIVLSQRYSTDDGATWSALDPRLGRPSRVALTAGTVALWTPELGLVRWVPATSAITAVAGEPSFTAERTWRVDPLTGRFIVFDAIENAVAIETTSGWTMAALPQPSPTETRPYVKDVESNGTTLLAISAWGVHRSSDAGVSWQLASAPLADAGRDLLVLSDGRFALVGGTAAYLFDASGAPAGTAPAGLRVDDGQAFACEDGTIITRGKLTRDLGATWQPLVDAGELAIVAERGSCGAGRLWVLARSTAWGYRLLRFDGAATAGIVAGNWEPGAPAWNASGPPMVRTGDGTFLLGGLAWREGDTAWTLRDAPARTWDGGATLFGLAPGTFYASSDGGQRWTATAATGLSLDAPDAFAAAPDGSLLISRFVGTTTDGTDTWQAKVWRSTDRGATWTIAYDATAVRTDDMFTGEAHRFVGVAPDGAWIATDAVSHDGGATWQRTEVEGDRGLALLTRHGNLVTPSPSDGTWRVYASGGLGELQAAFEIEIDGMTIPASQLRSAAFDDAGHAYVAGGAPYVRIWRSRTPVEKVAQP